MLRTRIGLVGLAVILGLWGCDDDESGGTGDTGGGDTGGDVSGDAGGDATPIEGCDVVLTPSGDDYAAVQQAFQDTPADSAICFQPGTYSFSDELSITTRGITVRGVAEGVIFDFSEQEGAANGMLVTGNDFTIEDIAIRNSPGDGIRVEGAENIIFRNLDVRWDGEPRAENGAYAIFPVQCNNVLVEDSEVFGASDAGIYVGQSTNIVVRNNVVHGNVLGIEIENSTGADVYGNHAYDNAGGIVTVVLPNLPVKTGARVHIYDNISEDNNRDNFAAAGNFVASVPTGTGIMVLAVDEVEIDNNTISGNETFATLIVSYLTVRQLIEGGGGEPDPETDVYPETVFIHDNTYTDNGTAPHPPVDTLLPDGTGDITWDGATDAGKPNENRALDLCIQEDASVTFLDYDLLGALENPRTDVSAHDCTHAAVPAVELPFAE